MSDQVTEYDLLYQARLELARRGDPKWAPKLRRLQRLFEDAPPWPQGLPHGKALKEWLRRLSEDQRKASMRFMYELGYRLPPEGSHGEGSECQARGCACTLCDPLGEQAEALGVRR